MMPKLSKRQRRKFRKLVAACVTFAALTLASSPAQAEPITAAIATALMYVVGYGTATAIASAIVSFAISTALSYATGALTKSSSGGYSSAALSNRTHMVRSSIAPRNIVYGRSMVSGPLAFIGTSDRRQTGGADTNNMTGTVTEGGENQFLHLVVLLANHEIDAVEEVYLGDEPIGYASMTNGYPTGGKFGGVINNNESTTVAFTLAANATSTTLASPGAQSLLGLVEIGQTSTAAPGGGEGGVDAFGNPILPNGGTAAVNVAATLSSATSITGIAPVNRSRSMAATILSKGIAASYVRVKTYLGTATQSADADLIDACPNEWGVNHRLRGIAYLYVRLIYTPELFPNGIPNIKARIRGAKVRDVRSGTYPNNAPTWTSNYALCALHYIKDADGLNCPDSDIDLDQVKVAANICDEVIQIRSASSMQGARTLWATQKRYEAHGVLLLDHDVEENLRSLSTAGGGPVPLLVGGKFQIPVGYYGTPIASGLTDSDLRAAVKVRPRTSRRDLFNAVGGTYVDGEISWQPTDFPEVANSLYKANDGGEKIRRDVTFPFTTDEIMAQRLAKILLERSRQAIAIEWPGKPSCFRVTVGDLVPVTLSKFGWTNKVFRCVAWSMQSNGAIDLVLQEDATGIYDWNMGQATTTDLSKDTDLPDPSYIAPMGALTVYSDSSELIRTGDGTIISRLHVLWPATTDAGITNGGEFQVEYKKAAELNWIQWDKVNGQASETWISPVVDTETYFVRVRAVNARGIRTDWVYAKHTIIGNTAPPPNVSGFAVSVRADGTRSFSWTTNNQPINVTTGGGYRIKYRTSGSGTAWANMTPLHNGMLTQSPLQIADPIAGTYDFAIVSVNAGRYESTTPSFVTNAKIGREPVDYSASSNLLLNSDWQMSNGKTGLGSLHGWSQVVWDTGGNPAGLERHHPVWNPGRGGMFIRHDTAIGNPATGSATACEVASDFVTASAGSLYEASLLVDPHRCAANITLTFYDINLGALGGGGGETLDVGSGDAGLGGYQAGFAGMRLLWCTATAPAGTAFARLRIIKFGTNPGNTNSYLFANRAMLCVARAGVTRATASPWIEAGMDQLHGGSLTNLSVDSAQIANEASTSSRGYINPVATTLSGAGTDATGLVSIGYTAPVDCIVTLTGTVNWEMMLYAVSWNSVNFGNISEIGINKGQPAGAPWRFDGTEDGKRVIIPSTGSSNDTFSKGTTVMQRVFTMAANEEAIFYLFGHGQGSGTDFKSVWAQLRLEAVKK